MKRIILISNLIILTIFSACGGSTRGTGGAYSERASVNISGQLVTEDEAPIEGFTITILETGDSTVTDSNGLYSLDAIPLPDYTLLIEPQQINDSSFNSESEVMINNSLEDSNINADLVLDTEQGIVEIEL